MITFPNAKINLGLNVVSRRPDGYHNLETVFYPINLCDALEFVPAVKTSLNIAGLPVSGDIEQNLVVRAFRLLQSDFQLPELEIALLKNIPMGAGLGGGSADAAFMLKLVNEHFRLNLSVEQLETYAAKLGADCPFFIRNKPVFAAGIGNEFSSLEVSLKGYYLVLVKPDVHVSTAEAYAHVACQRWDDLMQEAEGRIFELSQKRQKKGVTQIDPVIDEALARLNKAAAQTDGLSGVCSGFHALDKITSGWQKSDLVIIAARPAMGKTAFVLSMAKNMAVDYNIPVAVFSLEMSNVQLVNRLIVNVCEIPGEKIKSGQLEPHEWAQLDVKIKKLEGAPIYIDDTPSLSILEFQTKARRLKEENDIQIIIIDYLQLMNASGMKFQSREQEVSTISRSLKGLAKELDIPIIALSQLNRNVENRGQGSEGKKPQLSDLRESGAIEQDADMVCFIHRPEYYKITTDPSTEKDLRGIAQIIIAKHRNGATGDIDLVFKQEYARFMNEEDTVDPFATLGSKLNNAPLPSYNNYNLPPQNNEDTPF